MFSPALAGLFLFMLLPFVIAIVISFTNYRFNSPLPVRWIGLENYTRLFSDTAFRHGLGNNLLFAVVVVPLQTALALGLALLVNRPLKRMVFFRTVFFLPVIYPMALVSVVSAQQPRTALAGGPYNRLVIRNAMVIPGHGGPPAGP